MILTARPTSYPVELRQRAVRTVIEVRADYPSEFAAIDAVAKKLGIRSAESR
jgi:transposase